MRNPSVFIEAYRAGPGDVLEQMLQEVTRLWLN